MFASRLLLLMLVLVGSLVIAAPPSEGPRPVESPDPELPAGAAPQYQLGRSLLQQGDSAAALPYLQRAFRLAPGVERFGAIFLDALVGAGRPKDALEVVAAMSKMYPQQAGYRRRHGLLLAQAGRYQDALGEVRATRAIGPDDLELVKLEMDLHESLKDVKGALAVAAAAEGAFPDQRVDLVLMQAGVLRRADRAVDAAKVLGGELALAPDAQNLRLALLQTLVAAGDVAAAGKVAADGDARQAAPAEEGKGYRYQLAELLGRQGRFAEAAELLTALRAKGEAGLDAQLWLGRLLLGIERTADALALLPEVATRWPDSGEAHYLWGKALVQSGDSPAALLHFREGTALAPDRTDIRLTLLQSLVFTKRGALSAKNPTADDRAVRAEVEEHARAAAALVSRDDPTGQLILGYAYRALGETERAAGFFATAAEVNDVRLQAAMELAFCQQDLGQIAKARQTLEALYKDFPDDPEVANSLGYLLAEQGKDLQRAEKLVRQALRSEPESGPYLDSLGWIYYQRGEYAGAFDLLVEAVNQRPDDAIILEHLGLTMKALGQRDRALDVLRRSLAAGGDPTRLRPLIEGLERSER
jgi:tetratricopeptide (TPR) repeat protein